MSHLYLKEVGYFPRSNLFVEGGSLQLPGQRRSLRPHVIPLQVHVDTPPSCFGNCPFKGCEVRTGSQPEENGYFVYLNVHPAVC
jgi:hypothetical protein